MARFHVIASEQRERGNQQAWNLAMLSEAKHLFWISRYFDSVLPYFFAIPHVLFFKGDKGNYLRSVPLIPL